MTRIDGARKRRPGIQSIESWRFVGTFAKSVLFFTAVPIKACLPPPNAGAGIVPSPAWQGWSCSTCIGRWPGWARRCRRTIKETVLSHPGRYQEVYGPREHSQDPSPLKVKNVQIGERRYVVCVNAEQARKDRADREAIVRSLEDQLRAGPKSLVGNKGYRKFLKSTGSRFTIDHQQVKADARFDGKWVLQTDLDLPAAEVALGYKDLWMVESLFRSAKSILETRPIYHKRDETIRGHVFCSFLALVLLKELYGRLEACGWRDVEWQRLKDDLERLEDITVINAGRSFVIRSDLRGDAGKAIQAVGVALGPVVRMLNSSETPVAE